MINLPTFETSVVPSGTYEAEVISEVLEKPSSFDKERSYFELVFFLRSDHLGEFSRFVWPFTPRSPRFAEFLIAIGGTRLPNGNVSPPRGPYISKKVLLNISQRTSKSDKAKIVNEVLAIYPFSEAPAAQSSTANDDAMPF